MRQARPLRREEDLLRAEAERQRQEEPVPRAEAELLRHEESVLRGEERPLRREEDLLRVEDELLRWAQRVFFEVQRRIFEDNLTHSSSDVKAAKAELKLWFPEKLSR